MSQQHMDFSENYGVQAEERENKSSASYNSFIDLPGQKLSPYSNSTLPSSRQRLILAIVSLGTWAILFSLALVIIILTPSFIYVPSTIPGGIPTVIDNPTLHILYPLLGFGLLVFSIVIIIVNILFNRKR